MKWVPWWVRILAAVVVLIWKAPGWLDDRFETKWNAMAEPYKQLREEQFKHIEDRLTSMDRKLDILIGK